MFSDQKKIIILDSLQDHIIVNNKEMLMVMPRNKIESIQKLKEVLIKRFGNDFCSWLSLLICSIKRSVPDPKRTKSKCSVFRLIS